MGVLQRFERRLGGLVEGAFAKVFRGSVEPVELAHALQREADEHTTFSPSRRLVPNDYVVSLGPADWERLAPYAETLGEELATMLGEHCRESGYSTIGPIRVGLEPVDDLAVGTFRLRSGVDGGVPDRVTARRGDLDRDGLDRGRAERLDPAFRTQRADRSQFAPDSPGSAVVAGPAVAPPPPAASPPAASPRVPVAAFPAAAAPPEFDARPAPPAEASLPDHPRLVVIGDQDVAGDGPEIGPGGYGVELAQAVTLLGRGTEAHLRLAHTSVSRRHAQIEHYPDERLPGGPGHWVITDLGSTNGTSVNGRRVERVEIRDGDRIDLGGASLVFRMAPRESAARR